MPTSRTDRSSLLSALPVAEFIDEPEIIDRLLIRLMPDGHIYFRGTSTRVSEFLHCCAADGIAIYVDYRAYCG